MLVAPPPATCLVLQALAEPEFSLASCRDDFCPDGTDGYVRFITLVVELVQGYAIPLVAFLATLIIVQITWACNLKNVRKVKTAELAPEGPKTELIDYKGQHAPQRGRPDELRSV